MTPDTWYVTKGRKRHAIEEGMGTIRLPVLLLQSKMFTPPPLVSLDFIDDLPV